MKIAVVGGGGAGMACAYYLAKNHEVVVFEKQPVLGGNIRTLGLNVPVSEAGVRGLDAGVIEFVASGNQHLQRLLDELGVTTSIVRGGSTSLYLPGGDSVSMLYPIKQLPDWRAKLIEVTRLLRAVSSAPRVLRRIRRLPAESRFGDALDDSEFSDWLRLLIMYGFSMPYSTIDDFPLDVARETLNGIGVGTKWRSVDGGTYRYIDAILAQSALTSMTDCGNVTVRAEDEHFSVSSSRGQVSGFDKLVIATPPGAVVDILKDLHYPPIDLFTGWRINRLETVVHTDDSLYRDYRPRPFTEFDVFLKEGRRDGGYNAYLNRLAAKEEAVPHYFLAYNLDEMIDPAKVVHRQYHETAYLAADTANRQAIRKISGSHGIYFAGAYLYDGLHNGAVQSACAVVDAIASESRV